MHLLPGIPGKASVNLSPTDRLVMLGARIRAIRAERGLNQTDFGALAGVSLTTQQQYEAGKNAPTADYFFRLAQHDIVIDLFADREDDVEFVALEEIDLAYGLGGSFSDVPIETDTHRFPRSWVEGITSSPPSMLTIARGRGDSMMPTLLDGDMIIVDRSQRSVREQDAIWALTVGEIAMIKRLRIRGEQVQILSDNDRVPPDDAHASDVNIVGRVIFIGRRL
jgi:phage repressor protein C with HTH and peptisase S24 domain